MVAVSTNPLQSKSSHFFLTWLDYLTVVLTVWLSQWLAHHWSLVTWPQVYSGRMLLSGTRLGGEGDNVMIFLVLPIPITTYSFLFGLSQPEQCSYQPCLPFSTSSSFHNLPYDILFWLPKQLPKSINTPRNTVLTLTCSYLRNNILFVTSPLNHCKVLFPLRSYTGDLAEHETSMLKQKVLRRRLFIEM